MMMIMIKLMNDEGHSDESDNDDVPSIFISSLASVIKSGVFSAAHECCRWSLVITPGLTDDFPQCDRDFNLESKVQPEGLLITADRMDYYRNKICKLACW